MVSPKTIVPQVKEVYQQNPGNKELRQGQHLQLAQAVQVAILKMYGLKREGGGGNCLRKIFVNF